MHWFIVSSPSAGEIQGQDTPSNVKLLKHDTQIPERLGKDWALVQPGWLLWKPFAPVHPVVAGQIHGKSKPGLPLQAGAVRAGAVRFPAPRSVKHSARWFHVLPPPTVPSPTPQGWCQQLWLDWLELILHSGIFASYSRSCKMQCSDTKLVWQVTISHPPAFISATTGHIEVMQLPDCKRGVWELLASLLFYTAYIGLDRECESVMHMEH